MAPLSDAEYDELMEELLGPAHPNYVESTARGGVVWHIAADDVQLGAEVSAALQPAARYSLWLRTVRNKKANNAAFADAKDIPGAPRAANIDASWRVHRVKVRGNAVKVFAGADLTAGQINGICNDLIKTESETAVGYVCALVPVAAGKRAWLAMREGEANCVVKCLRQRLPPSARPLLKAFDDELQAKGGCDESDLHRMVAALKAQIIVVDSEGHVLWRALNDKGAPLHAKRTKVVIYRCNGHAYLTKPVMPKPERLEYYNLPRPAPGAEPLPFEEIEAAQLAFISALPRDQRYWTVGHEIVSEGGTLWRTDLDDETMRTAMHEYGDETAVDSGPPVPDEEVLLHVGGVTSYRFRKWREKNGIAHIPKEFRSQWEAGQVEAGIWNTAEYCGEARLLDMRHAYLACGKDGTGLSSEWAERCGFPGGAQKRAAVEAVEQVKGMAGIARVVKWKLAAGLHPASARILSKHLAKKQWVPIPLLEYLTEAGHLAECVLEQVIYSLDRLSSLEFDHRDVAVRMVGSCKYAVHSQTIITRDPAEAEYYNDRFLTEGRSSMLVPNNMFETTFSNDPPRRDALYKVTYDASEDRKCYSHIRAYVLAYMQIHVIAAIASIPPADILYACSDGIAVKSSVEPYAFVKSRADPLAREAGAWVWKPMERNKEGKLYSFYRSQHVPAGGIVFDGASLPGDLAGVSPLPVDPIAAKRVTFLDGQGGSGKTYRALRAFPERRAVILVHTNKSLERFNDPEENPHGYRAYTYHEFFHLGVKDEDEDKAVHEWTACSMGRVRPDVVVWDEIGVVPRVFLEKALDWLKSVKAQVVLAGDPLGQIGQHSADPEEGQRLMDLICKVADQVIACTEDHRAKGDRELQAVKLCMWRKDDDMQHSVFASCFPSMTEAEALASWTPSDTVVVSTNALGADWAKRLNAERDERFPDSDLRIRFGPVKQLRKKYRKRNKQLPLVIDPRDPEKKAEIRIAIGTVLHVPAKIREGIDWQLWKNDFWSTVHSLQGLTVCVPRRLLIVDVGLTENWNHNTVYTAVSRVQSMAQVVRVTMG